MDAQQDQYFTESEIFQALHWGMPDSTARNYARVLAAEDPAVQATIPDFRAMGPIASTYSEELLLLLSLVSDETNRKVEARLVEQNNGRQLSPQARSAWEKRRNEYRTQLIKAGKIPER